MRICDSLKVKYRRKGKLLCRKNKMLAIVTITRILLVKIAVAFNRISPLAKNNNERYIIPINCFNCNIILNIINIFVIVIAFYDQ